MDSTVYQLLSRAQYLAGQFDREGRITKRDIDEAIRLDREALELCPPGHDTRSQPLTWLSIHLSTRYMQFGEIGDVGEAIEFDREALSLCPQGHPDRAVSLVNLAVCLVTRYNKLGALSDLEEAIALDREALTLHPQDHLDRSTSLDNLGICLSARYEKLGAVSDLDEAIALGREALTLRPLGHPDRPKSLSNLGARLSMRYDGFGAVSDLDEAIVFGSEALTLRPKGHPDRSESLNNLGIHLFVRHKKFGAVSDLDEAIVLCREALTLYSQGHPDRSMSLNNLGMYLSVRYEKFGVASDLDEAIVLGREALTLRSRGHPYRSMSLHNLAARLYMLYLKSGASSTLDEVIALNQETLTLIPQGHPDRSVSLIGLGIYLSARYDKSDMISDLNEAIILGQEALVLQTQGHPERWRSLDCVTYWLTKRYNFNTSSNDMEEAFRLYTHFADVSYTVSSGDLDGCRAWIRAAETFKHSSTRLAYETCLRLLVEHLSLLPSLPQHLVVLKEHTSSLAVDAFSACLRNHSLERAVELLEQGRSVFWNQLTRLHSPLDDVITSGPAGESLAKKFSDLTILVRKALHSADNDQHDHVYHLNIEIQSIVTAIRRLPGLSRFLLPSLFSDLRHAAREGPVIIVNASQYGCDALIVIDNGDPVHIPLSITREYVKVLSSRFHGLPRRGTARDITYIVGVILRELWEDVISPIVHVLRDIHPFGSRIWWCPTAEFSDLPLHAAGPYRKGQRNLPDLYISSYTPTLSALIRARRVRASNFPNNTKRFIAVGQAKAVGERELLSVTSELTRIGEDVKGAATFRQIEGEESRISLVAEGLGKSEWVHLACHGLPNRTEPFKSAFALRDGHFTIEQIIRCELDNPEFAYLSACRTTVGDEESPDESIHLALAMQYLGFRSVIGTMWSVDDSATNAITSRFYKHILDPESGRLDYTRAAFALNETMKTIPMTEITLDQRVLYIHLGA